MKNTNTPFAKPFTPKQIQRRIQHLPACLFLCLITSFLLSNCAEEEPQRKELHILTINDMHASIDQFPKLAFLIDSLRNHYPDLLVCSAGDNQTGNPVNDRDSISGMPMITLMNAVGFDLSVVGNHEFDQGTKAFAQRIKAARFPFICANMFPPDSLNLDVQPYCSLTTKEGLRIRILGLLQLNSRGKPSTNPDSVSRITFRSPYALAREYRSLKDSCDIYLALTHLGYEEDQQLADTMKDAPFDVIMGGHSHTLVKEPKIIRSSLITQAGSDLHYASLIHLIWEKDKPLSRTAEVLSIDQVSGTDPKIQERIDKMNRNPFLNEILAQNKDTFPSEEQLGYFMADAKKFATGADIAVQCFGGVRLTHFNSETFKRKDIYSLDPFDNPLVLFELSPEELTNFLEEAYQRNWQHPTFTSGISIHYDKQKDPEKPVITYQVTNKKVRKKKRYTVVLSKYVADTYRFTHQDSGKVLPVKSTEAIVEYLKSKKLIPSYKNVRRFTTTP
ncbi:MAG: hypothetical protein CSB06_00660 [Bacteroidia bacterium]|nr:MAG: hypothetical protein CSB06_00660 [Bacteroidia bacterium]